MKEVLPVADGAACSQFMFSVSVGTLRSKYTRMCADYGELTTSFLIAVTLYLIIINMIKYVSCVLSRMISYANFKISGSPELYLA